MGAQTRSLEDAVALTLPLPARLTFVLVFLIFQLYSLALQVYMVSQEEIPKQIESLWQRWFIRHFFLGFLKRGKKTRNNGLEPAVAPPRVQLAGANPPSQPNGGGTNGLSTHGSPPETLLNGNNKAPEPVTDITATDADCAPSWTSLWLQINALAFCIVGIALSIPTFNKLQVAQEGLNTQTCKALIDGDIAGDGVRAALWVQQIILWLSVGTGPFLKQSQSRPTAVKELAAGLVVTHLSLAIAVLVQIRQGTLTPLDAAIVVMILDAQNAALAVSFSSRETLAARWEVISVSTAQFFGLVVIGVVLARFEEGKLVTADCGCFSYFWWAWQSTCLTSGAALPRAERVVLWMYYAFRWLNSLQNWHFGVRYMWIFNFMEQDSVLWDGVGGTLGVPPTIGFFFCQNLVFGLVSSVSAELTITGYTSGNEPKPFTVGQITAMVIAVITTLRATWLFIRRFDLLPKLEEKFRSERGVEMQGLPGRGVREGSSDETVKPLDALENGGPGSASENEQEPQNGVQ